MPDLNLIDEGGIEETSTPSAPMPPRRGGGGGGSLNKILMAILVLLIVGTAGFYLYKKGKWPFKKKTQVVAQMQEETFPEEPPLTQQTSQQAMQPQDTSNVALLETPLVDDTSKEAPATKGGTPAAKKAGTETMSTKKFTDMEGNFTVQVSAFRDKKQADEIVGRLEDGGYPAFVETIPMKGVNWYTVRIGHYPSRNDAKKAVADFALELRSNYWIDRVRTKQQ
jgi:cell division protein FtsN